MADDSFAVTGVLPGATPSVRHGTQRREGGGRAAAPSGTSWLAGGNTLPPAAPPRAADLARAVERLQELASSSKRSLQFSVDEVSGRTVITVIDADTAEVVRQIPPEEVLAVSRTLDSLGALLRVEV